MVSHLADSLLPSPTVSLDAKVKEMQLKGMRIINLGVGEPDYNTPVNIQIAAINALKNGFTHYAPISGLPQLKSAIIKKFHKENKIEYDQSQIIVGLGSKPLLYLAFLTLINKDDEVLIPTPTWSTFSEQVRICGGKSILIKLKPPFKLTAQDIESKINKKTKILLLNSPSNPTGMMIEKKELLKIAKLAVKHGFYIISDEIYEKLVYIKEHVSVASLSEEIREKTLTINGFSKAYAMTGWRIGYAGGPTNIISAMTGFQSQVASSAVTFAQVAAIEALEGSQEYFNEMFNEFRKRRTFIISGLNKLKAVSVTEPEGAFYVFVSIEQLLGKKFKTAADWCEALLEKELVAVVPGEAFFYPGYFRLSFAASEENLKEALNRINKFIIHD